MTTKEFDLKHFVGKMTKTRLDKCLKLADNEIKVWKLFKKEADKKWRDDNLIN